MRISVVIPTFNDHTTLLETFQAIQNQQHKDYEVIVVNDGGATPVNLMPGGDARYYLYELTNNQGAAAARNLGLSKATGEIVYFLDADDLPARGLFQIVSDMFRDSTLNMVFFKINVAVEGPDHPPILPPSPLPLELPLLTKLDTNSFCNWFEREHSAFIPSLAFIRRKWLQSVSQENVWNVKLRNGEDTHLFLRLAMISDFHHCDVVGVTYRVRKHSLSKKNPTKTWQDRVLACRLIISLSLDEGSGVPRKRKRVRRTAWRLQQNALRRIARIHLQNCEYKEAVALVSNECLTSFDVKMLAQLVLIIWHIMFSRVRTHNQ